MMTTPPASLSHAPVDRRGRAGFSAQDLFPGRTSLRVRDVAQALGITRQQVVDLIEEYRDTSGRSGLGAIDVSSGLSSQVDGKDGKERRCQWRIPVAEFEAFIRARWNLHPVEMGRREVTKLA